LPESEAAGDQSKNSIAEHLINQGLLTPKLVEMLHEEWNSSTKGASSNGSKLGKFGKRKNSFCFFLIICLIAV